MRAALRNVPVILWPVADIEVRRSAQEGPLRTSASQPACQRSPSRITGRLISSDGPRAPLRCASFSISDSPRQVVERRLTAGPVLGAHKHLPPENRRRTTHPRRMSITSGRVAAARRAVGPRESRHVVRAIDLQGRFLFGQGSAGARGAAGVHLHFVRVCTFLFGWWTIKDRSFARKEGRSKGGASCPRA